MSSTSIRMLRRWISKGMKKKKEKKDQSRKVRLIYILKKCKWPTKHNIWILSSILNTSPSVAVTFVWTKTCWMRTTRELCSMFYSLNIIILPLLLFVCRILCVCVCVEMPCQSSLCLIMYENDKMPKIFCLSRLFSFLFLFEKMLAFSTNNMLSKKKTSFSHKNHFQDPFTVLCVKQHYL